jgi:hypothetical protein
MKALFEGCTSRSWWWLIWASVSARWCPFLQVKSDGSPLVKLKSENTGCRYSGFGRRLLNVGTEGQIHRKYSYHWEKKGFLDQNVLFFFETYPKWRELRALSSGVAAFLPPWSPPGKVGKPVTTFHGNIIWIIEGSLEVKLPTIWTDEKQSREEAERRERLERRVEEKE